MRHADPVDRVLATEPKLRPLVVVGLVMLVPWFGSIAVLVAVLMLAGATIYLNKREA